MSTSDKIQLAVVVAAFLAVVVALFGDWLKAKWFRPTLILSLSTRSDGIQTKVRLEAPDGTSRLEDARYWFLTVSTAKRWPVANDVRVCLTQIEAPGPDGLMRPVWVSSELPVLWDFQEIRPL
jgi:hypothetical protein